MQLTEEGNRVSDESTSCNDNDSGHETDPSGSPKSDQGENRPNTSILDRMLSSDRIQCSRQRQSPPSCHCHPYKRREDPICSHPPSKRLKEVQ